jgi:hypothetical protein
MKCSFRLISIILIPLLTSSIALNAQFQLVVVMNDGLSETFPLEQVRSITFNESNMNINRIDGVVFTWDVDNIDNYHFAGTLDTPLEVSTLSNHFVVFPNPVSENVSVSYNSQASEHITIELLDVLGKQVQLLYSGIHQGYHRYKWETSIPSGSYICRLKTATQTVSKTVIVQ